MATIVDSETFTIKIDGTDYSVYCNSVSETGGNPNYTNNKAWNGSYYKTLIGYEDKTITANMIVNDVTLDFITDLQENPDTHTIDLADTSVYDITYTNVYFNNVSYSIAPNDIMMANIEFVTTGALSNKTVS